MQRGRRSPDDRDLTGTYTGTYTDALVAGAREGTIALGVATVSGAPVSGFVTANFAGITDTASLTGAMDCSTGQIVLKGTVPDGRP
jgi:hypothetical protein